jgi:hypothetical protein
MGRNELKFWQGGSKRLSFPRQLFWTRNRLLGKICDVIFTQMLNEYDDSITVLVGPSGRPRTLRRRSAAARLLSLGVQIPPGAWMFVCCECCVLSGRGLCDELITRPEESYRLWCVVVCGLQTSWMGEALAHWGLLHQNKRKKKVLYYLGLKTCLNCDGDYWKLVQ